MDFITDHDLAMEIEEVGDRDVDGEGNEEEDEADDAEDGEEHEKMRSAGLAAVTLVILRSHGHIGLALTAPEH